MTAVSKYAATPEELEFAKASMPIIPQKQGQVSTSKYAASPEEMEFANAAMAEPEQEEIPWYKSYPAAAAKGLLKGTIALGQMFGGLPTPPAQKEEEEEERSKFLEKVLPSQEGPIESFLERAGKIAPGALAGPGGAVQALVRTGIAAGAGEIAQNYGAGETGQAIAETIGFIAPNPTRLLQSGNAGQQNLINFSRRMGLTEEQIAPVIQQEGMWNRFLTGSATRRGRTQRALQESQRGLGQIYDTLRTSPAAQTTLNPQQTQNFINHLGQEFHNLPTNIQNEILGDIQDLARGPFSGERLINLYQDVNDTIQRVGGHRGRRLGGIQHSIMDAIASSSPELAMDLNLTNQLYANYARMRTALQPTIASDLLSGAKAIGAVVSLITGEYTRLSGLAGVAAGRKLASELLINPRLQNIQHKMLRALNENRIAVANKLLGQFRDEIKEIAPEFYDELQGEKFSSTNQKKSK